MHFVKDTKVVASDSRKQLLTIPDDYDCFYRIKEYLEGGGKQIFKPKIDKVCLEENETKLKPVKKEFVKAVVQDMIHTDL